MTKNEGNGNSLAMYTLSENQVKKLLDPTQVIAAIESAFRRDYHLTVRMPTRIQCDIPPAGVFLLMPCYDSALPGMGVKLVTFSEGGDKANEHLQASYVLLNPDTGELDVLMAANYLTDVRTAATSAVATKFMARNDADTLGVFGTGRQARAHIAILPQIRNFRRILVCGSQPTRSEKFVRQMAADNGVEVEAVDARTCVSNSDVLCTCTTSKVPLFDGDWLLPGTHLNLIGAFRPETREVDDKAILRSRLVVDTYDGALAEAGDLLIPLRRGLISREHIVADLHEIVSQKRAGRQDRDEITVFKSVGCALEDLVTAKLIYDEGLRHRMDETPVS